MDPVHLIVQVLIALGCGLAANVLIPRQIPGRVIGLFLVGFLGVLVGEWGYHLLRQQFSLNLTILQWSVEGVPIIPSIIGSAIVLYVVTSFLRWGNYSR
jgi:uncharacterized membrane protein YeaQ/YmgE (transglycosylase-associated protein family)